MSAGTSLSLPVSVLVALWLPAVEDDASARQAARAIRRQEDPPRVHRLAGQEPSAATSTDVLTAVFRSLSPVLEVAAVLPQPGDLMGAPAICSGELLDAGEGVLLRRAQDGDSPGSPPASLVAIPYLEVFGSTLETGEMLHWHLRDLSTALSSPATLLGGIDSLAHARREVTQALHEAVDILDQLDVARDRPDLADILLDLSLAHLEGESLPPGLDPRRLDLLERSARLLAIVELALDGHGAAVTSASIDARAAALTNVARSARHALVAATAHRAGPTTSS